ncbi:MAG: zinc-binding alcohol dehydrogenase family protein [Gemmatimonadota bacterium]|nr:zinc-binding alcohol dehydrogenase family protein [Gemmatimonadota bacterium]
MKALRFDKFELDALKVIDLDTPVPGETEALVRVRAAGMNPSDVKNVLGKFHETQPPRTPGRDFAGVVEKGPEEWLGREVWGTGAELGFTHDGTHAEYVVVPASGLALKPTSLSFPLAASCGVPYTTAWNALRRGGMVVEDRRLVVIGAGAVGSAAIALSQILGTTRVIAAVLEKDLSTALRASGVPIIVLSDAPSFAQEVMKHFVGGADLIFDTTGQWVEASVAAIAEFGRIATIAAPKDGHVRLPLLDLYRKGGVLVGVNSLLYDVEACAEMLEPIAEAFDRGEIPAPHAVTEVALTQGPEIYRAIDAGSSEKFVFAMR